MVGELSYREEYDAGKHLCRRKKAIEKIGCGGNPLESKKTMAKQG